MSAASPGEWVQLGAVLRAHGVQGAMKVKVFNPESETLRPDLVVRVSSSKGAREHRVIRYAAGVLVLEGVDDKDAADAMRGSTLDVRRVDFADPKDLYLVDLIGAPVVDESGAALGTVRGFLDSAQGLMIVQRPGRPDKKDDVAVPYVPAIVIDAKVGRVVLRPPRGLFDEDVVVDDAAPPDDAAGDDEDEP